MRNRWPAAAAVGVLLLLAGAARHAARGQGMESGTLAIYFMDEKVGYEDYTWSEEPGGYVLKVTGRMTKPLRLEVESLTIRVSRDFIPAEFSFKGSMNGTDQDVTSVIREGRVRNTIKTGGQESVTDAQVRRDALILPNPIFSPYLVLAKKYGCGLKEKAEVSVYMVPQVEITGSLENDPANPCRLLLKLAGVEMSLETDAEGRFLSLSIPAQGLKVVPERSDKPFSIPHSARLERSRTFLLSMKRVPQRQDLSSRLERNVHSIKGITMAHAPCRSSELV
jgi:hypothetical protein